MKECVFARHVSNEMIFDLHIPRGGSIYDTVYVISASHGGHRSKFNAAEGKLIFGRY